MRTGLMNYCCMSNYLARLSSSCMKLENISTLDYQDKMERSGKCLF